MDAIEDARFATIAAASVQLHAGFGTYTAGPKPLETHWQQAVDSLADLRQRLTPWLRSSRVNMGMWAAEWGDPQDAAVKRKIEDAVQHINRLTRENAAKSNRRGAAAW